MLYMPKLSAVVSSGLEEVEGLRRSRLSVSLLPSVVGGGCSILSLLYLNHSYAADRLKST